MTAAVYCLCNFEGAGTCDSYNSSGFLHFLHSESWEPPSVLQEDVCQLGRDRNRIIFSRMRNCIGSTMRLAVGPAPAPERWHQIPGPVIPWLAFESSWDMGPPAFPYKICVLVCFCVTMINHSDQKQLGEENIYFGSRFQVVAVEGSQGRN